jgi:membrane-bound lytic murein transglycosylase D
MPNETRNYVPKLQAVKNIVANPDAFRAELPLIENHPYFQTVDITRDIDVELAARWPT